MEDPKASAVSIYSVLAIKLLFSIGLALMASGSLYTSYYSAKGYAGSVVLWYFLTVGYCFFAAMSVLVVVVFVSLWVKRDAPFIKSYDRVSPTKFSCTKKCEPR